MWQTRSRDAPVWEGRQLRPELRLLLCLEHFGLIAMHPAHQICKFAWLHPTKSLHDIKTATGESHAMGKRTPATDTDTHRHSQTQYLCTDTHRHTDTGRSHTHTNIALRSLSATSEHAHHPLAAHHQDQDQDILPAAATTTMRESPTRAGGGCRVRRPPRRRTWAAAAAAAMAVGAIAAVAVSGTHIPPLPPQRLSPRSRGVISSTHTGHGAAQHAVVVQNIPSSSPSTAATNTLYVLSLDSATETVATENDDTSDEVLHNDFDNDDIDDDVFQTHQDTHEKDFLESTNLDNYMNIGNNTAIATNNSFISFASEAECRAPFTKVSNETFASLDKHRAMCTSNGCCLPCPFPLKTYNTTMFSVFGGVVRIITAICSLWITATYTFLPTKNTYPKNLLRCLSFAIVVYLLSGIPPITKNGHHNLCVNQYTPANYHSPYCGMQGFFSIWSLAAMSLWAMLIAINTNVLCMRKQSSPILHRKFYYFLHIIGWVVPTILAGVALPNVGYSGYSSCFLVDDPKQITLLILLFCIIGVIVHLITTVFLVSNALSDGEKSFIIKDDDSFDDRSGFDLSEHATQNDVSETRTGRLQKNTSKNKKRQQSQSSSRNLANASVMSKLNGQVGLGANSDISHLDNGRYSRMQQVLRNINPMDAIRRYSAGLKEILYPAKSDDDMEEGMHSSEDENDNPFITSRAHYNNRDVGTQNPTLDMGVVKDNNQGHVITGSPVLFDQSHVNLNTFNATQSPSIFKPRSILNNVPPSQADGGYFSVTGKYVPTAPLPSQEVENEDQYVDVVKNKPHYTTHLRIWIVTLSIICVPCALYFQTHHALIPELSLQQFYSWKIHARVAYRMNSVTATEVCSWILGLTWTMSFIFSADIWREWHLLITKGRAVAMAAAAQRNMDQSKKVRVKTTTPRMPARNPYSDNLFSESMYSSTSQSATRPAIFNRQAIESEMLTEDHQTEVPLFRYGAYDGPDQTYLQNCVCTCNADVSRVSNVSSTIHSNEEDAEEDNISCNEDNDDAVSNSSECSKEDVTNDTEQKANVEKQSKSTTNKAIKQKQKSASSKHCLVHCATCVARTEANHRWRANTNTSVMFTAEQLTAQAQDDHEFVPINSVQQNLPTRKTINQSRDTHSKLYHSHMDDKMSAVYGSLTNGETLSHSGNSPHLPGSISTKVGIRGMPTNAALTRSNTSLSLYRSNNIGGASSIPARPALITTASETRIATNQRLNLSHMTVASASNAAKDTSRYLILDDAYDDKEDQQRRKQPGRNQCFFCGKIDHAHQAKASTNQIIPRKTAVTICSDCSAKNLRGVFEDEELHAW